jgi:DNA gyrase subunit B
MMPQVIENGFLYLAQPPLYRIAERSHERYLQNDDELNKFLVERAVADRAVRVESSGANYDGSHLKELLLRIFDYKYHMDRLERRGLDRSVLRILANAGLRNSDALKSEEAFAPVRAELERDGFTVKYAGINEEHSLNRYIASRRVEGHVQEMMVSDALFDYADYRKLLDITVALEDMRVPPYVVSDKSKGGETRYDTMDALVEGLMDDGRKSITIQRYKGLGEMNPSQLWETTMDPVKRVVLQVKLEDAVAAEEIFDILMGDDVEPRKAFIKLHALEAGNIDI